MIADKKRTGSHMSILARYRKPGGFVQLLKLIETSQSPKQEKLLEAVEKEDPEWAQLIRVKKLSSPMVLSWDNETLVTIFEHMLVRHTATIFKKMGQEKLTEFRSLFRTEQYNEIYDTFEAMSAPLDSEYIAATNHLLEVVRHLDEEKKIVLRFIDARLDLSDAA